MVEQSPFASSTEATSSMWEGNGTASPSEAGKRAEILPQTIMGAELASRRSHSTPDMATFQAQGDHARESAPSFSFHGGAPLLLL